MLRPINRDSTGNLRASVRDSNWIERALASKVVRRVAAHNAFRFPLRRVILPRQASASYRKPLGLHPFCAQNRAALLASTCSVQRQNPDQKHSS